MLIAGGAYGHALAVKPQITALTAAIVTRTLALHLSVRLLLPLLHKRARGQRQEALQASPKAPVGFNGSHRCRWRHQRW